MSTILLLIASNVFMTFAWYGHLKYRTAPIYTAIGVSWLIALGEYCLQVPANRLGYGRFSAYQLKLLQEVITLAVFVGFAYFYMGERLRWNHAAAVICLLAAVAFAFYPTAN
ncbi:MAG: DMT family protein [Bryobacter sp.]|nr:DMT family protein [Bryobacter sp.]